MMQKRSDYDEIVLKVYDLLKSLGVNPEAVSRIMEMINSSENLEQAKLSNMNCSDLPKLDMSTLTPDIKAKIVDLFRIIKLKNLPKLEKFYFDIALSIGELSFIELLTNTGDGSTIYIQGLNGFNRRTLQALDVLTNDKSLLVKWCVQRISEPISPKFFVVEYLNTLYQSDKSFLEAALADMKGNARIFLTAYLVYKDAKRYKELRVFLEKVMENSLSELFESSAAASEAAGIALKYIRGGLFVTDKLVDELRGKVNKDKLEKSILQALVGISNMVFSDSQPARRFTRMMFLLNSDEAFTALYAFNSNSNLVFTANKEMLRAVAIPYEAYVAWLGNMSARNSGLFDSEIKKELAESKSILEKALKFATDSGKKQLERILSGEAFIKIKKDVDTLTAEGIDTLENLFVTVQIPKEIIPQYIAFFKGEKDFSEIKESVISVISKADLQNYHYGKHYEEILRLKGKSPVYNRALQFFIYGRKFSVVSYNLTRVNWHRSTIEEYRNYIDMLEGCGIAEDGMIPYLVEYAADTYGGGAKKLAHEVFIEYAQSYGDEVIRLIPEASAQQRLYMLQVLFGLDPNRYLGGMVQYLGDSAKSVRDGVAELLCNNRTLAFDAVKKCIGDKRQAVREAAVQVLLKWNDNDSKGLLAETLKNEKTDKIKNIISASLNIETESDGITMDVSGLEAYCRQKLAKAKGGAVSWIGFDFLPPVRYAEKEQAAKTEVVKYAVLSYASSSFTGYCCETDKVLGYLNRDDFASISLEILNTWIAGNAETKRKWVLPFAALYGDDRVTMVLKKEIENWAQSSRGSIAADAVRALAMSGRDMALMMVDNMARSFKQKQVREAASGAFEIAAKELNLDPEELADRIVPSLDFNEYGERILDYGSRKFIIRLSTSLDTEIYDENEKKLKSLPAPGKNDDADLASKAAEEYKALKKKLKAVANLQALRLEAALATDRKWNFDQWYKLFIGNPIMHRFAIALIWGTYADGKLEKAFRYMEDGSYNTVEEEEYQIPAGSGIGLIHPMDISGDELNQWITQLKDYEITQPFDQLSRKTFALEEKEKEAKSIERFGGIKLNAKALLGKMIKYGWNKGSVQDGGWYSDFYKENRHIGIGAELRFSGVGIGMELEEEITVLDIMFYKAGSVRRGSYVYDEINDQKRVEPAKVPHRFFSEILYDVERATLANTGFDEKWREKKH